jgi:hypothetical protein
MAPGNWSRSLQGTAGSYPLSPQCQLENRTKLWVEAFPRMDSALRLISGLVVEAATATGPGTLASELAQHKPDAPQGQNGRQATLVKNYSMPLRIRRLDFFTCTDLYWLVFTCTRSARFRRTVQRGKWNRGTPDRSRTTTRTRTRTMWVGGWLGGVQPSHRPKAGKHGRFSLLQPSHRRPRPYQPSQRGG